MRTAGTTSSLHLVFRRRTRHRKEEKGLNEEHSVFTGDGASGGFCGGGEGGDDGGEHHAGVLGGVDGRVQTPGAVILHQGDRLPVVGVQAGVERRLVVVAAADERLARHLSADERRFTYIYI